MEGLTVRKIAKDLNVSVVTVRNWIKSGYLVELENGVICKESFKVFLNEIAGKRKLCSRANKLLKDGNNYSEVTKHLKELIRSGCSDEVGSMYEGMLSDSYRNREGIYYTPVWVVRDMLRGIKVGSRVKFLDPCCGSGNFLIEAIRCGVSPCNVYGVDVDENAVLIAKYRIKKEFGVDVGDNIRVLDFLDKASEVFCGLEFDLIFTNPPWGKKIDRVIRKKYAKLYGGGDSLDTASLFLAASLKFLRKGGFLGFLVQEAFFKVGSFEAIRKRVLEKKIIRFVDYGYVFRGISSRAYGLVIENERSRLSDTVVCQYGGKEYSRGVDSFLRNPKCIFNFWVSDKESKVIDHLYSIKHVTLKGRARWGLGIITGDNRRFCSDTPKDGYLPVYRGSDITKGGLKEPSTFIVNDFSKFQQVAPLELYHAKEKIIYRFISSELCFYCDTKQRYILNSANFFIPFGIGISSSQLVMLLNSDIIGWLFKKLFMTHKVLKSDLELLPIHYEYFLFYKKFKESDYLNYLGVVKTDDGSYSLKNKISG